MQYWHVLLLQARSSYAALSANTLPVYVANHFCRDSSMGLLVAAVLLTNCRWHMFCSCRVHENYTSLLHFVLGQSAAAAQVRAGLCCAFQLVLCISPEPCRTDLQLVPSSAHAFLLANLPTCCLCDVLAVLQATAVAFGSNHTAGLMINPNLDGRTGHHSLYTHGRGKQTD
jgi:hypothetical protein